MGSPAEGDSTWVVAAAGIRLVEGIHILVGEESHSLAVEENHRSSRAKRRAEEWAGRRGRGPGQGRKEADRPGWILAGWLDIVPKVETYRLIVGHFGRRLGERGGL